MSSRENFRHLEQEMRRLFASISSEIDYDIFKENLRLYETFDTAVDLLQDQRLLESRNSEVRDIFRQLILNIPKIIANHIDRNHKDFGVDLFQLHKIPEILSIDSLEIAEHEKSVFSLLIKPPYYKSSRDSLLILLNSGTTFNRLLNMIQSGKITQLHILPVNIYSDIEKYVIDNLSNEVELGNITFIVEGTVYSYITIPPVNLFNLIKLVESWIQKVELKPDKTINEWVNEGVDWIKKNEPSKAKLHFDRALELDPKNIDALVHLGQLSEKDNYDKAISLYNRALELDPKNIDALVHLGQLSEKDNYDKAISLYNRALELDPQNSQIWRRRGEILIKANRFEEALTSFKNSIKIRFDEDVAQKINKYSNRIKKESNPEFVDLLFKGKVNEFNKSKEDYIQVYGSNNRLTIDHGELLVSDLSMLNLSYTNVKNINFSDIILENANMVHSNLQMIRFDRAKLTGANFSYADLTGANFSYADLTGANFSYADLTGANMSNAKLNKSEITDTNIGGMIFPAEFEVAANLRKMSSKELISFGFNLSERYTDKLTISFVSLLEDKSSPENLIRVDLHGTVSYGFLDLVAVNRSGNKIWLPNYATFDSKNYKGTLSLLNKSEKFLWSVKVPELFGISRLYVFVFEDTDGNFDDQRKVVTGVELV